MVKLDKNQREALMPLFKNITMWKAAYLSAIEDGYGDIYADNSRSPNVAALFYGGLVIYAGDPSCEAAKEIIRAFPEQPLVLGYSEGWNKRLLDEYKDGIKDQFRYHLCYGGLDKKELKEIAAGNRDKAVKIGSDDLDKLEPVLGWEHQKYHYKNEQEFLENGYGYLVKQEGAILSGASAFIRARNAAECQINTVEKHQRKGYARIVGSRFIDACINNEVEIPWDAANEESVLLAKSLGYRKAEKYLTYSIM